MKINENTSKCYLHVHKFKSNVNHDVKNQNNDYHVPRYTTLTTCQVTEEAALVRTSNVNLSCPHILSCIKGQEYKL